MNDLLIPQISASQRRELDRLARDPAALELAAICRAMKQLHERIGDFRADHVDCPTSGRSRCALCTFIKRINDSSGTGPFDLLSTVHTTLSLASDLINNDRPFTEDETEESPATADGKAGAA